MIDRIIDERTAQHRYKATRLATLVGALLMGVYVVYELVSKGTIRWDLFVIMGAMAATKLAAMLYYRITS
jgi:hypothetical protein